MKSVNRVILLGSVGKDPEVRTTTSGTVIASFSLATTEKFKSNNEWKEETTWHNIVAFAKTAEIARDYIRKGSPLYLEGRIQTRTWEKEGQKQYRTEVAVNDFVLLGGKGERNEPKGKSGSFTNSHGLEVDDSDVPF